MGSMSGIEGARPGGRSEADQALDNALVDPAVHADEERIHQIFADLRAHDPVRWTEPEGYRPFWSLTRHADIMAASRANDVLVNSRRLNLMSRAQEAEAKAASGKYDRMYRTIAHMDNPEHRKYRGVTRDWFMGRAVNALDDQVSVIANHFIDRMAERNGEVFDFAKEIANLYPLRVIMSILGVPAADEPFMLRLTQEFFGAQDPDLKNDAAEGRSFDALPEIFDYFTRLAADCRETPRDDLATVIAQAQIDGTPMGDLETASYYSVVATAGHDTTAASTAGGMLVLMQQPEIVDRLRADPDMLPRTVEEMIRWVSPVKHFLRTAVQDYQIGDITVRKGESIAMFHPSANRDGDVFPDPFRFRPDRTPNRHMAFGFGGHMCLGILLARLEMTVFFREFIKRVDHIELSGDVRRVHANLVGGFKQMPVVCRIRN